MESPTESKEKSELVAQQIQRLDIENILKRAKAGKPLTESQRQAIRNLAIGEDSSSKTIARSKTELAEILGVSRKTIGVWLKTEDAPKIPANNISDVTAWREWITKTGKSKSVSKDAEDWRGRKEKAAALLLELEYQQANGKLVDAEAVKRDAIEVATTVKQRLLQLPNQAANLVGLTAVEIQEKLRGIISDALRELSQ